MLIHSQEARNVSLRFHRTLTLCVNHFGILAMHEFRIPDEQVLYDLVNDVPEFAAVYMNLTMNGATE